MFLAKTNKTDIWKKAQSTENSWGHTLGLESCLSYLWTMLTRELVYDKMQEHRIQVVHAV